jgi:hypothetical protein
MGSAFSALLADFGKKIGIADLAPDEAGYCCLAFDEVVVNLEFNEASDQLFLSSHVGDLPDDGREALYEQLLEANYFFRGTNGAVLSVDTPSKQVVLLHQTPTVTLDGGSFETLIENFVNVAERWVGQLSGSAPEAGQDGTSEPSVADPRMRV